MGQGPVLVQVWIVPGVCEANRELPQCGMYPLNGRVLSGVPAAIVELSKETWDDFAERVLAAAGLQGGAQAFALLDTQAGYAELGPGVAESRGRCVSLPIPSSLLYVTAGVEDGHRAAAFFGSSGSGVRMLPALGVELAVPSGVARVVAVPRVQHSSRSLPQLFLWVKAFLPELRLLGGFFFPCGMALGDAGAMGLQETLQPGVFNEMEFDWWHEEVSMRILQRLDKRATVGSLGIRSGHVLVAHPVRRGPACEELYASAREHRAERSTTMLHGSFPAAAAAALPTRLFAARPANIHEKSEADTACHICLDNFVSGDLLKSPPCFHNFHARCLDKWLAHGHVNSSCPVCRHPVQ